MTKKDNEKKGKIILDPIRNKKIENIRMSFFGGITKKECVFRMVDDWFRNHPPEKYKVKLNKDYSFKFSIDPNVP